MDTVSAGGLAALGACAVQSEGSSDQQLSEQLDWISVGIFRRICKMGTKQEHLTQLKISVKQLLILWRLTLHIQSEVACSPSCLVAHHLVHSTVTPGGAADGDGADRGEVGRSWKSIKVKTMEEIYSLQHSDRLIWEDSVHRRGWVKNESTSGVGCCNGVILINTMQNSLTYNCNERCGWVHCIQEDSTNSYCTGDSVAVRLSCDGPQ